jgi:hypothetical protein
MVVEVKLVASVEVEAAVYITVVQDIQALQVRVLAAEWH